LFSRITSNILLSTTNIFNRVASASVIAMMLLTCADVILRYFRCPIPGTYEMVGLFGSIFVSFSLAKTSLDNGHIAVDFFFQKFPPVVRKVIEISNTLICTILFGFITWYSFLYALDLKRTGEVSMTLQIPVYPFVLGITLGCAMLCIILILQLTKLVLAFRSNDS
jgi:TRAP-type C4-dicarboxylate transport system permease small subunit